MTDDVFAVIAEATRRDILIALRKGDKAVGELVQELEASQPTISKHLKVLEDAGIVERKVEGRVHQFRLRRKAVEQAGRWIARHQAFWEGAVNQLDRLLAEGASDDRG